EDQRIELLKASGQLSRPNRAEANRRRKEAKAYGRQRTRLANKSARKATGIRSARETSIIVDPAPIQTTADDPSRQYQTKHRCYVCKASFTKVHHFYDSMCPSCGDLNYLKRFQKADLQGQVALITGSRLKIGYQATLMLLKAGATVIAT